MINTTITPMKAPTEGILAPAEEGRGGSLRHNRSWGFPSRKPVRPQPQSPDLPVEPDRVRETPEQGSREGGDLDVHEHLGVALVPVHALQEPLHGIDGTVAAETARIT